MSNVGYPIHVFRLVAIQLSFSRSSIVKHEREWELSWATAHASLVYHYALTGKLGFSLLEPWSPRSRATNLSDNHHYKHYYTWCRILAYTLGTTK